MHGCSTSRCCTQQCLFVHVFAMTCIHVMQYNTLERFVAHDKMMQLFRQSNIKFDLFTNTHFSRVRDSVYTSLL